MSKSVVLITGALTGIGRATAIEFAKQGANIVVSGRKDDIGLQLQAELKGLGADATYIRSDVRDDSSVKDLVDATLAKYGRLDIAVNNAGTEGQPGPVTEQTAEKFTATFETNVLGVLLSMKHELRVMQAQGSGSIVNISSAYGKIGAAGAAVYVASKHAVEGLTKSAALENAETGIRINAVAPGPIDTGMLDRFTGGEAGKTYMAGHIPLKRLGKVEEIARAVVFVGSEAGSYVTGTSFSVDGGATL